MVLKKCSYLHHHHHLAIVVVVVVVLVVVVVVLGRVSHPFFKSLFLELSGDFLLLFLVPVVACNA